MALTVSSIATDSANDVRNVLDPVANLNLFTSWIDRVNKDCCHSSVYSTFNISIQPITTVSGTGLYPLSNVPPIRRIVSVYDQSRDRMLFPIERATAPVNQLDHQEASPGQAGSPQTKFGGNVTSAMSFQSSQPEYFKFLLLAGVPNLRLYPYPKQVLTYSVGTENQVVTLVNSTDQLVVPEDGRDMVVAGVNWLANMYLKRAEEAQVWLQVYDMLKKGNTVL